MSTSQWLLLAASIVAPRRPGRLRRALSRRLRRTTLVASLRLTAAGQLRVGAVRLRVFGILPSANASALHAAMALPAGQAARMRIVALDRDGALVAIVHAGGRDLGASLLREGHALVRGTGNRRYRQAQARAQVLRLGAWRRCDCDAFEQASQQCHVALPFPWWQG